VFILALAAATLYGSADFLGGVAARRASPFAVSAASLPAGAAVVLLAALLASWVGGAAGSLAGLGGTASATAWATAAWAAVGGVAGAAGLIAFYAGFANAPMSVVAPVSALVSTLLPVGVAIADGERPGPLVIAGALFCMAAIVLVSLEGLPRSVAVSRCDSTRNPGHRGLRGVGYGVAAGVAFGVFFLCLKNAGHAAVLWPVVVQRLVGSTVAIGALVVTRTKPLWRDRTGWDLPVIALASGALDSSANVCYVLATRAGLFGLAVVITSLYPGVTVLLARLVLRERMRAVQRIGLLLAATGIILVTV
jgi:drug/metabolite transporter (DMT)-like permease